MSLRAGLISALAAAALTSPIEAQAQGQSQDAITVIARDREAQDQQIVCKYEAKTGSRFKEKTCRTRLEWDQISIQHQRDAKELIDRPLICGGGGSPEGC